MINPNPSCEKDCRFTYSFGVSTCLYWVPEYDKYGKLITEDPNTHRSEVRCKTCNKQWEITEKGSLIKIDEINFCM